MQEDKKKQEFPDQPYNKMLIQGLEFKLGKNMPIQLVEDLSLLPQNSVRQLSEYIQAVIARYKPDKSANYFQPWYGY